MWLSGSPGEVPAGNWLGLGGGGPEIRPRREVSIGEIRPSREGAHWRPPGGALWVWFEPARNQVSRHLSEHVLYLGGPGSPSFLSGSLKPLLPQPPAL